MATSEATDQASQTSARTWRTRLRGYLARRTRQFLRVLLVFVIGLLFLAGALEGWRGAHLIGLPDIADPFGVAAFRSLRIPRDQDAFVLFRQAEQKLTRMPGLPSAVLRLGPVVPWPKVAPELRDWLMANRSVLESFKDSAERPDGIVHPGFGDEVQFHYLNIGQFAWLAHLEASRLEDQGDMAGAWSWYRALFRMKVHVMRRGSLFQRYVTDRNLSALEQRLTAWAADRRTGVPLIRQALDVILGGEPKPEWDAFSLRIEYIEKMRLLGQEWGWVQQGEDADQHVRIFGEDLPPNMAWIPYAAKRYLSAEPERSRRVTRLAFANWLAHVDDKDPAHQKPAVRAKWSSRNRGASVCFFPVNAQAPDSAKQLAPQDLAKWFIGSRDARVMLEFFPWPALRTTERRAHRALVVALAGELYQREHGKPRASDEDLVGPYLDHLPSDGSDELDDGSTATIENGNKAAALAPG